MINSHAGFELAVHEPPFSRPLFLLGNFFRYHGWNRSGLVRLYIAMRKSRIGRPTGYIELNPFLCPLADLLADIQFPLKLAHLVRDPRTWVPSLIAHEASGRRKMLVRMAPFNLPRDRQFKRHWHSMTLIEKMLWRWSVYNRNLSELQNRGCHYRLFRYEDLLSGDAETMKKNRLEFLEFLAVEPIAGTGDFHPRQKYNASRKQAEYEFPNWTEREVAFMHATAGDQLAQFGYS